MAGLTFRFHTIRAAVAGVAAEIGKTARERRILFGPGFQPCRAIESRAVFVDPQTFDEIMAWGKEGAEHAAE